MVLWQICKIVPRSPFTVTAYTACEMLKVDKDREGLWFVAMERDAVDMI